MVDLVKLTPEEAKSRRKRSIAIGIGLAAMVVLFYVVAILKFIPESLS